jgi:hypothetical protein
MHEVRISAPEGNSKQVVGLALHVGIAEAAVYEVYVHGPNVQKQVISVETSTPRAKDFIDALFSADWFDPKQYSITTRELRAIFSSEPVFEITKPMVEPALDVLQDLWQLNHITASYIARAAGGALLLAYGMFHNNAIAIVVAALFLPFLSQVLAIGFGLWAGDWHLSKQGAAALGLSTILSIAGGAIVALLHGGPLAFSEFQTPLVAFGISSVIGIAAGLSTADDAGRRYLIGVAAAVQYAIFPVWFGSCIVLGFPGFSLITERTGTFATNIFTIAGAAALVYMLTGMRRDEVHRFRSKTGGMYSAGPRDR